MKKRTMRYSDIFAPISAVSNAKNQVITTSPVSKSNIVCFVSTLIINQTNVLKEQFAINAINTAISSMNAKHLRVSFVKNVKENIIESVVS